MPNPKDLQFVPGGQPPPPLDDDEDMAAVNQRADALTDAERAAADDGATRLAHTISENSKVVASKEMAEAAGVFTGRAVAARSEAAAAARDGDGEGAAENVANPQEEAERLERSKLDDIALWSQLDRALKTPTGPDGFRQFPVSADAERDGGDADRAGGAGDQPPQAP